MSNDHAPRDPDDSGPDDHEDGGDERPFRRLDTAIPTVASASEYKVRGRIDAPSGIGVLGHNTATSGEPVGVAGLVDVPGGWGVYTPDDAGVEGTLGTTGSHRVTVDGERALSLGGQSAGAAGNVVAGHARNSASGVGIVVAGGGFDDGTTTHPNAVRGNYGTVGGGRDNLVDAGDATVGGGRSNHATGRGATVGGGENNDAAGRASAVGGGSNNAASGTASAIAGGRNNRAEGETSAVGGGEGAVASGKWSAVGGGERNRAAGRGATVAGGRDNSADAAGATVAGGTSNVATALAGTVPGGAENAARGQYSLAVGEDSTADGDYSVAAGRDNTADGRHSVALGRGARAGGYDGTFVFGDGGSTSVSATAADEVRLQANGGMIVQMNGQTAFTVFPPNTSLGLTSFTGDAPNVVAGHPRNSTGLSAVRGATIGGGGAYRGSTAEPNEVSADYGTIGGGRDNRVSAVVGTVPGGAANTVTGAAGFAAGEFASANHANAFVWADGSDSASDPFTSGDDPGNTGVTGDRTFSAKATGGVRFVTSDTAVTYIEGGTAGWQTTSSRSAKTNVESVDSGTILDGVTDLEVSTWEYEGEDDGRTRYIGPMAEDFHDVVDVGTSDRHINSINADGVALAAIQGLADRLERKDDAIEDLRAENDRLRDRVETLEAAVFDGET